MSSIVRKGIDDFAKWRKKAEHIFDLNPDQLEKAKVITLIEQLLMQQFELGIQNEELCQAQAELESSRNKYLELYDFAPISYFSFSPKGTVLDVNMTGAQLLNREKRKLYKINFKRFLSAASFDIFDDHLKNALKSKNKISCQVVLKETPVKYLLLESIMIHENRINTSITDITNLKQARLDLFSANQSLRLINQLFQSSTDAISALDTQLRFLSCNNVFKETFFDIFNKHVQEYDYLINFFSDYSKLREIIVGLCQDALRGKAVSYVLKNPTKESSCAYYELKWTPILDEENNFLAISLLIKNISQNKIDEFNYHKKQAQIAHADSLNVINEVSSTLAHEINQPLTAINIYNQGCIATLEAKTDPVSQKVLTGLKQISTQVEYACSILMRMRTYSIGDKLFREPTDINELIKEAINFLSYSFEDVNVQAALSLSKHKIVIKVDRLQIMQVLLNLIQNSLDAIKLFNVKDALLQIKLKKIKDIIEFHILDNGPGIPPEVVTKIFNPYYTTKSMGRGLGLSICRTIIEAHSGKLFCKPYKEGAYFIFSLPYL